MVIQGRLSKSQSKAIDYFAQELFSRQMRQHIHVRLSFVKTNEYWGLAIVDDYNAKGMPRYFTVEVKRDLNEEEKLMSIAHELVHIRQYATGQLNEEMTLWQGESVNSDLIPYLEQPWEIEAYELGDKLYKDYKNGNV
jgi:hypothetical protein